MIELSLEEYSPLHYTEVVCGDDRAQYVLTESYFDDEEAFCSHYRYFYKITDRYGQLDGGKGYVYILENSIMPGVCKIGSTSRTPEERCAEINRVTGVLKDFTVANAFACKAPECIEKLVHEELRDVRITSNKEGFYISVKDAEEIIKRVIKANKAEIDV